MESPTYLRNYVRKAQIQPGLVIRSVFLDSPNDLVVKTNDGIFAYFENDDRRINLTLMPTDTWFPVRTEEEGGQIDWEFEPLISDLAAGDRLLYLGDTINVHDVYRRPGEDWVRLTTTIRTPGSKGTSVRRAWCNLTDKADFNTVYDGSHSWDEFPLETAGPYIRKDQDEPCRFYVSPLGRGYTWRIGKSSISGFERVTPSLADLKRDYTFLGDHVTQRHPNDGNVRRRALD